MDHFSPYFFPFLFFFWPLTFFDLVLHFAGVLVTAVRMTQCLQSIQIVQIVQLIGTAISAVTQMFAVARSTGQ